MSDVIVIGAGITGLTAAYELARRGRRVAVLEAAPRAGGLIQTTRVDGFTMYAWLESTSLRGKLRMLNAAQRRLPDDLRSEVRATKSLTEHAAAIAVSQ